MHWCYVLQPPFDSNTIKQALKHIYPRGEVVKKFYEKNTNSLPEKIMLILFLCFLVCCNSAFNSIIVLNYCKLIRNYIVLAC